MDGGVIVASILLAFSIDASWDARQEMVQRTELLANLNSDFVATQALLATSLARHETLLSHNRALLTAASGGTTIPGDSLATFVRNGLNAARFRASMAHYEAAIASGAIDLLESDSLPVFLNRFDAGRESFQRANEMSGQYYFMGPIQGVISEFGGFEALLRSDDLGEVVMRPEFQAIVEVFGNLLANSVDFLQQMDQASAAVTEEIARLQGNE